ncbi:hypothetical protein K504DRAFT_448229 [Pleomassaria siparia CBS 279.74]|uniref:Rhodopsin domain-containing protein n=1 Tax=Pleomassaria siparia CBS 279.74 TaxID=1314801 RepID=A0A6G1JYT4_9PLEO|nr:hypothetical protein K504DRAFT_448229 [Pleomassaria siparia CBS 279.74]
MHTHSPSWLVVSTKAAADIGYPALVPAVLFTILAFFVVTLRWYTRVFLIRRVEKEDVLLTIALTDEVKAHSITTMMKLVYAQSIIFHTGINLVKISILTQYTTIFSHIRYMRKTCRVLHFFVVGAAAWGVLGVVLLCHPTRKYWLPTTPGSCLDIETHFWSSSMIGIFLDVVIWILPMPVIGTLQLESRQKVGLLMVFGLGVFVCIASVLRLALVHNAAEEENVTKSGTYAVIWSTIEINIAIICASLLVMKPLFTKLFPKLTLEPPTTSLEDARDFRCLSLSITLSQIAEEEEESRRSSGQDEMLEVPGTCHLRKGDWRKEEWDRMRVDARK